MNFELIHTSAPKGLKPGSRGFTTVAMTDGIPPPLSSRLEALSGYRFLFDAVGADAGRNPPAFSHYLVTIGSRKLNVVSRVAPAGSDYSGRTNKIAHHVVVSTPASLPGGPAALCQRPELFRESWSENPRIISAGPTLDAVHVEPRSCTGWAAACGDAGWGGRLLDLFSENPRRLICVLYPPTLNALELVSESLALLPPGERWQVTFTTALTAELPADVQCSWRFVPRTQETIRTTRTIPGAVVLDLAELPTLVESRFVDAARAGESVRLREEVRRPTPAIPTLADSTDEIGLEADLPANPVSAQGTHAGRPNGHQPSQAGQDLSPLWSYEEQRKINFPRPRKRVLPWAMLGAAVVALASLAAVGMAWWQMRSSPNTEEVSSSTADQLLEQYDQLRSSADVIAINELNTLYDKWNKDQLSRKEISDEMNKIEGDLRKRDSALPQTRETKQSRNPDSERDSVTDGPAEKGSEADEAERDAVVSEENRNNKMTEDKQDAEGPESAETAGESVKQKHSTRSLSTMDRGVRKSMRSLAAITGEQDSRPQWNPGMQTHPIASTSHGKLIWVLPDWAGTKEDLLNISIISDKWGVSKNESSNNQISFRPLAEMPPRAPFGSESDGEPGTLSFRDPNSLVLQNIPASDIKNIELVARVQLNGVDRFFRLVVETDSKGLMEWNEDGYWMSVNSTHDFKCLSNPLEIPEWKEITDQNVWAIWWPTELPYPHQNDAEINSTDNTAQRPRHTAQPGNKFYTKELGEFEIGLGVVRSDNQVSRMLVKVRRKDDGTRHDGDVHHAWGMMCGALVLKDSCWFELKEPPQQLAPPAPAVNPETDPNTEGGR